MLYFLYGNDTQKARKKLNTLINALLAKKKDAMLLRVNNENFSPSDVRDLASTQGLFESKSIIVFDSIFENTTDKEILLDNVKDLQESQNVFIILEEKPDKKSITKITKYAEKVQEFLLPKGSETRSGFNIFELSDALGMRNRKKLWVLYQTGKLNNVSDEEMHGILFWGTKNMLLAKSAKTAKEAGLSSFVYGKAKKFSDNFSEEELCVTSGRLLTIYHDARRGIEPLTIAFEKFVLTLK